MSKHGKERKFRCPWITGKKADYMETEGHHQFSHVSPAELGEVNGALSPFLRGGLQVSWDNLRGQD